MVSDEPASPLAISLLGPFCLQVNGARLPRLGSWRKQEAILALLVLRHPQPLDRAYLAGLLWPDCSESQGLATLRRYLTDLRRSLGSAAERLHSPTSSSLALDLVGVSVDLIRFDAAVARGDRPSLEAAVALYRGPLLEGWTEEWVFQERQAREQAYLEALEKLATAALDAGDVAAAEGYLRRAIAADPLREGAQRALMQVLAERGSYAAALEVYRELRLHLHRAVNAGPDRETQELFQQLRARAESAAAVTPASRSSDALRASSGERRRHNLPAPATPLLGRDREVSDVRALLQEDGVRLVTLTGPGGVGKTRLALHTVVELRDGFPDGVYLVRLASLRDPALIPSTIVQALGLQESNDGSPREVLEEYLRDREILLLLDNFEHLLEAALLPAELLAAAPRLKLLVTSRAVLHLSGEHEYAVPPLALPGVQVFRCSGVQVFGSDKNRLVFETAGPEHLNTRLPEYLIRYAAVTLFVQRARVVRPGFALTDANAPSVAEICHRLDGLPLAIELAAARIRLLSPQAMLSRLEHRLKLLTGGARDLPARQQTLRGAIAWSYDLLTPAEQRLFRRLGVFAGGCTIEAAEAVCNADGVLEDDPLDGLGVLLSHSLVRQEEGATGEPRFTMLETIREYALERLHDSGEAETIQDHHTRYYLEVLELAAPHLQRWTAEERLWMDRLEHDHANLRSALDAAEQTGKVETVVRMARVLWRFWYVRGYWSEGQERLNRLLDLTATPEQAVQRARLLHTLSEFAYWQGDSARARGLAEQSIALLRALGDRREMAAGLTGLAGVAMRQGDYAAAQTLLEEQLSIWLELDDQPAVARSLGRLASIVHRSGNEVRARSFWEECLATQRQRGTKQGVAVCLQSLGAMAFRQGDADRAWPLYEESLQIWRELKSNYRVAYLICELEKFAHLHGRQEAARQAHLELLEVVSQLAEERSVRVAALLSDIGQALAKFGDHLSARDLFAISLAIVQEVDYKGGITWQLANLGESALRLGDWNAARAFLEEGLPVARESGKRRVVARILQDLGTVTYLEGRHQEAARLYRESVALAWAEGMDSINRTILLFCLEGQARIAVTERRWQQAALLFGAAEALRGHLGEGRFFADLVDNTPYVTTLRDELSEEAFNAGWIQGQEMPLERALRCAQEQPELQQQCAH